ncbi:metallo-mystery pair system four-Cys motif protein [Oculatella sp. LEGE 06141]|uniref:MbnP family copper-binding protein n=1 Tax=Oculatella sp. LEGE 06141 TaxID=1828648 RepID=UPI001880B835|nr:MbnP family copper-binding protein [Oculatella sp. LEGE 06141]MBE9182906.1 metallo-mystery pair system four-Cys motif protein [Oculatella sp. LEGE 06141]
MKNRYRWLTSAALACIGGLGVGLLHSAKTNLWVQARAAEAQTVTLQFQARVGDQPFRCEQSYTLGTPASRVTPLDFRFYVSDVALIDASGNAVPLTLEQDGRWQYENVALLDFEDKSGGCANGTVEMNDRIVGTVPDGNYVGLQFTVGVPFELNHADSTLAASPLNLTSLWWNWQLGYKFARIDFSNQHQTGMIPDESTKHEGSHQSPHDGEHSPEQQSPHGEEHSSQAFFIHLGSTGCESVEGAQSPSSCSNPNRSTITLTEFDPTQNVIVADLAALVADTNLSVNQPNTAPGCMSEPNDSDCVGIMNALGLAFNGAAQQQTFFKVE